MYHLYGVFASYVSRGQSKPRLIFSRINGPNVFHRFIGGFQVTSSPPCWWTKTKDLSLASFVRPPDVKHFSIVIGAFRGWLRTSYNFKFLFTKFLPGCFVQQGQVLSRAVFICYSACFDFKSPIDYSTPHFIRCLRQPLTCYQLYLQHVISLNHER